MKTVRMTQAQVGKALTGEIVLKLAPGERVIGVHCEGEWVYAVVTREEPEFRRRDDDGVEMLMRMFGMKG